MAEYKTTTPCPAAQGFTVRSGQGVVLCYFRSGVQLTAGRQRTRQKSSADLDAQLELEVAEDFLDKAVHIGSFQGFVFRCKVQDVYKRQGYEHPRKARPDNRPGVHGSDPGGCDRYPRC